MVKLKQDFIIVKATALSRCIRGTRDIRIPKIERVDYKGKTNHQIMSEIRDAVKDGLKKSGGSS